jgi:choline dehydrogenase-like flavoprotein
VDWPVSYDELAPYYTEAETYLGLYGNEDHVSTCPTVSTRIRQN